MCIPMLSLTFSFRCIIKYHFFKQFGKQHKGDNEIISQTQDAQGGTDSFLASYAKIVADNIQNVLCIISSQGGKGLPYPKKVAFLHIITVIQYEYMTKANIIARITLETGIERSVATTV